MDAAIARLATLPGVTRRVAEVVLAELGGDLQRCPRAHQLASWAGRGPGKHASAGQRKSGQTRTGRRWLRPILMEAAQGAARTKPTSLSAVSRRWAARRGAKKARLAGGHALRGISSHVLGRREPDDDLGANYFAARDQPAVTRRLVRRLEQRG